MGDTTVQTGTQPNTMPQGDPAGTTTPPVQPAQQNGNGATPPTQKTGKDDEPLGPAGLKALQAERQRVDQLQNELKSLEPLKQLAAALGNGDANQGKSEIEQLNEKFAKYEADLSEERKSRWKAELAIEFGLTTKQAKRLQGATREEMAADAAELVEDFKVEAQREQQAKNGARPKPDRSQGGGQQSAPNSGLDQAKAQIAKRFGDKNKTT